MNSSPAHLSSNIRHQPQDELMIYGLRKPGKCLSKVKGCADRNMFVLGTCSVKPDNQIHLVDFDEDDREITTTLFDHPPEVSEIDTHPEHPDLLLTCYRNENMEKMVSLWRMENISFEGKLTSKDEKLQPLFTLDKGLYEPISINWNDEHCIIVTSYEIKNYSIAKETMVFNKTIVSVNDNIQKLKKCAVNPHQTNEVACIYQTTIQGIDMRAKRNTFAIQSAHIEQILDIDYNPNKMNQIATGGKDGKIRLWDLRQYTDPVMELSNHSHWVTSVAYNSFHDQLLLSTSTDTIVNLHSVVSVSSAPTKPNASEYDYSSDSDSITKTKNDRDEEEESGSYPVDGLVSSIEHHEDSVYQAQWSAADPWIYASVSLDGRVLFNSVPTDHKYKIIL